MTAVSPLDAPTAQQRASQSDRSVWVTASAGTGKTKVLTDRVLRLLLDDVPPERILCLTFTRAAASEMLMRVGELLLRWTRAAPSELAADLAAVTGTPPNAALLDRARKLFARIIEAPDRLRLQNIHSFCQAVLGRFPLESGVAPHFSVMDERASAEAIASAQNLVITSGGTDDLIATAIARLTASMDQHRLAETLRVFASQRTRLERLIARHDGVEGTVAAIYRALGLEPGAAETELLKAAVAETSFDGPGLAAAAKALGRGLNKDRDRGATITAWLMAPQDRCRNLATYVSAFLTDKDTPRKTLITNSMATAANKSVLAKEAERVAELVDRRKAIAIAEETAAILRLGSAIMTAYDEHKRLRALLDYDDLVIKARTLLDSAPGWVHYKLDGGIDHVLIDEAQDTNPDQWGVIASLTAEFFAGEAGRRIARTVFAVGDPKQSIYSFQGADPDAFITMRDKFKRRVQGGRGAWEEISLETSFRSTAPVLAAVDAVFETPQVWAGVSDQRVRHRAERARHAGLVELWPAVASDVAADPPPWSPPIAAVSTPTAEARLARMIARRIKSWTEGGELLASKGRPIRAGDVMVLVRKRGAFIEHLVRALKVEAVAVAGVDRMQLTEQLAVMDLMAFGEAVLLPEDDLTLAVVLKGPLYGLNDDQLFTLAHGRGHRSLWTRLGEQAREGGPFREALEELTALRARADFVSPAAFYGELLGPRRGRFRIVRRLGFEANDPIDEFVSLALAYERQHVPSLQGFLHWLRRGEHEIKRDLEQAGRDEVRILTVHGAKGLEAPIVFLPDALQLPNQPAPILWSGEGRSEILLRAGGQEYADRILRQALAEARQRRDEEYRRLLYVAMTRAQDRLYVCGWRIRPSAPTNCWYGLVESALARIASEVAFDFTTEIGAAGWAGRGYRLAQAQEVVAEQDKPTRYPLAAAVELPPWVRADAPGEEPRSQGSAPSRPADDPPVVRSPAGTREREAFHRGRLLHLLLQHLPDIAPDHRRAAAQRFLDRPLHGLDAATRNGLIAEALAVLEDPGFRCFLGAGARAEVPLVGLVGGQVVSGQIDRLVVRPGEVFVLDYKSQRPAPRNAAETPAQYLRQMAAYCNLLRQIHTDAEISCAILWTAEPRLMQLPIELLIRYTP